MLLGVNNDIKTFAKIIASNFYISNIDNKSFTEVGFFDTYPENNNTRFDGAWNVYPYLPSGNIIISDINRGLFVIRKSKS